MRRCFGLAFGYKVVILAMITGNLFEPDTYHTLTWVYLRGWHWPPVRLLKTRLAFEED